MKLVLFNDYVPGILRDDKVIDISEKISGVPNFSPQIMMSYLIEHFDQYRPSLEEIGDVPSVPISQVKFRPPLPEPTRIVCMAGNYMENGSRALVADREAFLKSPSAIIGDGDTVVLPDCPVPHFHHEAELGLVIGKKSSKVSASNAKDHIFGYINFIDVSARGVEPNGGSSFFWGKSWDTFGPIGPAIVTADEIDDPQNLNINLWVNGVVRQNMNTSDMGRSVGEVVEFATWLVTMKPGDLISTGTNHVGLGPIQDGDKIEMQIDGLGPKLHVDVTDEWKRTWPTQPLSEMTAFESSIRSKMKR
ncbi:MAG: fumarylacetoacetate hydrolase family protein [SAR202 cluster bacterium]|nr:fumarylacetoacetate hydrolase family protein [SAR202 cluster bacterium]|tara:strand:+ start:69833 stop:70747 length:915 start_codon:yes stop_codon:yes gene_type:complete